jgi:hypothetical protein
MIREELNNTLSRYVDPQSNSFLTPLTLATSLPVNLVHFIEDH